ELWKNLLEPEILRGGLFPHLGHGPMRGDLPAMYDGDSIAHRLRHFERVSAHQHGATATHELAEQILEEAGALGVQPHHWLVDYDHLGPVHQGTRNDQ